jgi:hypothetical protein
MHAGHYVKAIHREAFFDEHNVSAQCNHCNIYLGGNEVEYRKRLVQRWGEDEIKRLESQKYKIRKFTAQELMEISDSYRLKVKSLSSS